MNESPADPTCLWNPGDFRQQESTVILLAVGHSVEDKLLSTTPTSTFFFESKKVYFNLNLQFFKAVVAFYTTSDTLYLKPGLAHFFVLGSILS